MFYGIFGNSKIAQIFYHFKLVYIVVSYINVLLARHAVFFFRNKKGTGTEMHTAIVSGIVTGDVPVSYWPIPK